MAERQGFEPWIPCGIHAFQACAFSHSAISPRSLMLTRRAAPGPRRLAYTPAVTTVTPSASADRQRVPQRHLHPQTFVPASVPTHAEAQVRKARTQRRQTLMIDADDTLWENNVYFDRAISGYVQLINHPTLSDAEVRVAFQRIEHERVVHFGYGSASFGASMLAGFEPILGRAANTEERERIAELAASIRGASMELLDEVPETLTELAARHRLILVTKGNPEEQTDKLQRSGLAHLFHHVEVLHEKHTDAYRVLHDRHGCEAAATWMIGNSPRSDINPALAAGLHAVFVPHPCTWVLEDEPLEMPQPDRQLIAIEHFRQLRDLF